MKIRPGDSVVVIAGKDKNKTGSVMRVLPATNRIVVAGINMRTKHVKKTPQRPGQRLVYEASLSVSNVMVIDPKTKKRSRIGQTVDKKGHKQRMAKRSGEILTKIAPAALAETKDKRSEAKKGQDELAEKRSGKEEERKPAEKKTEKAVKEAKVPFWKKIGFGQDAMEDAAEVAGESRMKQDKSVPDQGQAPDVRSTQRGK